MVRSTGQIEAARTPGDVRELDELRAGVARAIEALGTGFLSHSENTLLRDRLGSGELSEQDYYRQCLRVAFRLLFLLVAEDRGLLHPPGADARARELYDSDYSAGMLRSRAGETLYGEGGDLWRSISVVFAALAAPGGSAGLGLPCLGSFLWEASSTPDLLGPSGPDARERAMLDDGQLLGAVRCLSFVGGDPAMGAANFRSLDSAAFGSVYEALLGLVPQIDPRAGTFALRHTAGNERKTTGSYYTPDSLVRGLLETALDPVLEDRLQVAGAQAADAGRLVREAEEAALLGMTVCDPAVGSGCFLLAAAERLARRLVRVRCGRSEPDPGEYRRALREVIRRCLYGVDINPMAVEVCKIALWLEMEEPGEPLSFLDSRLKVGNSLLGATPALLEAGIPDGAFTVLEGDRKEVVSYYRRRHRRERRQGRIEPPQSHAGQRDERSLADAWCAAFVWPKHDSDEPGAVPGCPGRWGAITESVYRRIAERPHTVAPWMRAEIRRLADEYRFFHWHLEFPEVFVRDGRAAESPHHGFDVVVGNPPFLNQLESATVSERGPAAMVRAKTGGAVRGYTDVSAAFLLCAAELCCADGRLALVQPQSLLAAGHARSVRERVLNLGALTSLWVSGGSCFEGATVCTCAPTVRIGAPRRSTLRRSVSRDFTALRPLMINNDELAGEETWAHLAAAACGVPEFRVEHAGCLGDIAEATADFRDQYYGLAGFLVEGDEVEPFGTSLDRDYPPIVTSGLIDLAACRWGDAGTRILKRRWHAPRIDRRRMDADGALGPWISARLVPKVIVAMQTKVLEVFVDEAGRLVPSIPLVTVTPRTPDDLWRVAAALASPVSTCIAMQKYAGAAMSADAIKLSAKQVLRLPVPSDRAVWDEAAETLRTAHGVTTPEARRRHVFRYGQTVCGAYGLTRGKRAAILDWWLKRLGVGRAGADRGV